MYEKCLQIQCVIMIEAIPHWDISEVTVGVSGLEIFKENQDNPGKIGAVGPCNVELIFSPSSASSPLGELFDHGLDSISVWLITISLYSMFGHGPHSVSLWEYYGMLLACLLGFFIAHWEKYNTGVLFLPWAYDVSQLVSIIFIKKNPLPIE